MPERSGAPARVNAAACSFRTAAAHRPDGRKAGERTMQVMEPARCDVDAGAGLLRGPSTRRYAKTFAELDGLYAEAAAYAAMLPIWGPREVYEVTDFRPSDRAGDLIFGVTRMQPGNVGGEFFLTRGHIHARADRPEIYHGQAGHGVMLMESPDGETRSIEIVPGAICYVPPFWIHRSVNVGSADLVMAFAYPADAGQDYGIIARSHGMRRRIVRDGAGGWTEVANPAWRPRTAEDVARLMAAA